MLDNNCRCLAQGHSSDNGQTCISELMRSCYSRLGQSRIAQIFNIRLWLLTMLIIALAAIPLWQSSSNDLWFWHSVVLLLFLVPISLIDYLERLIYNEVLLTMLVAGGGFMGVLLFAGGQSGRDLISSLGAAVLGFTVLLLLRYLSNGGVGGGDIKLTFVLGIWLGPDGLLITLLVAFALGAIMAMALLVARCNSRTCIPFAPFISVGAYVYCSSGTKLYDLLEKFL